MFMTFWILILVSTPFKPSWLNNLQNTRLLCYFMPNSVLNLTHSPSSCIFITDVANNTSLVRYYWYHSFPQNIVRHYAFLNIGCTYTLIYILIYLTRVFTNVFNYSCWISYFHMKISWKFGHSNTFPTKCGKSIFSGYTFGQVRLLL